MKTISRGIAALVMTGAVIAAGMGGTAATAATADTISTQCAKQETNLYRCTISGTTTKAVTEFPWSKTPGVSVAYGVYRMDSGNGTIEYTPDKIIVRFNEDYAKTHQNLQFGADGDGTMVPPVAPPVQTPPPGGKLRTPQRPQVVTETVKVQIDDYLTNTSARKAQVARYDDDRLLHRGEDRRQWGKAKWVLRDVTIQWVRSGDARVDAERRTAALAEAAGVRDRGQVSRITTRRKTIVWELREDSWRLDGRVARGTAPQHYLGQK